MSENDFAYRVRVSKSTNIGSMEQLMLGQPDLIKYAILMPDMATASLIVPAAELKDASRRTWVAHQLRHKRNEARNMLQSAALKS